MVGCYMLNAEIKLCMHAKPRSYTNWRTRIVLYIGVIQNGVYSVIVVGVGRGVDCLHT